MIENHNEVHWCIVPKNTPLVIRHCSKCNKKMEYYCSEKFRINGNHTRIDIWLIYKCSKCDSTLKLTINKGIKPHDISGELFDRFTHNDVDLAWDYAFDRNFLKKNDCVVQYTNVMYCIEGFIPQKWKNNFAVHLQSKYLFDLKLSVLLAGVFGISIGKLRCIVDDGLISTNPLCDIMKYRIKSDIEIFIQPLNHFC
ncbi:MAG: DUF1062 domain-containing protein [Defluviitaleaceae bacterium]|nr:DUF1062 domain-containing protein [Defluviitaleaceae bacterium]